VYSWGVSAWFLASGIVSIAGAVIYAHGERRSSRWERGTGLAIVLVPPVAWVLLFVLIAIGTFGEAD
jgi:hypothetical protein